MRGQLSEAYRILARLQGCLEKLAGLNVDHVYARLESSGKTTLHGDYEYTVLRLCQSPSDPKHVLQRLLRDKTPGLRGDLQGRR